MYVILLHLGISMLPKHQMVIIGMQILHIAKNYYKKKLCLFYNTLHTLKLCQDTTKVYGKFINKYGNNMLISLWKILTMLPIFTLYFVNCLKGKWHEKKKSFINWRRMDL